jgi:hypothetical protein
MPSPKDVIEAELRSRQTVVVTDFLKPACREQIGRYLSDTLDTATAQPTDNWANLDGEAARVALLQAKKADLAETAAVRISTGWEDVLNAALRQQGFHTERAKRLAKFAAPFVEALVCEPAAKATLEATPFPDVWQDVGHQLASAVHNDLQQKAGCPEWLILNRLLLASFFLSCDVPRAEQVQKSLVELRRSFLSVRGSLVRLPERIGKDRPVDILPPRGTLARPILIKHRALSSLLAACQDESQATASRNGIAQRVLKPSLPVSPEVQAEIRRLFPTADPVRLMQEGRANTYQQYNFTILAYMALAGIEQLLRARAQRVVSHATQTGWLIDVTKWLGSLGLSDPLKTRVGDLYSTKNANIRNRVMHGGLLEIEGQRTQNAQRMLVQAPRSTLSVYAAENIALVCLELLEDLDSEIAALGLLANTDMAWVRAKDLSAADRSFVQALPDPRQWGLDDAEKWRRKLFKYLSVFCPAANMSAKFGLHGWVRHYDATDSFVQIQFLSMTFETLYRLTVHLIGESVLRCTADVDGRGNTVWVSQYRVLDKNALLSDDVLLKLTRSYSPSEQVQARRTFNLAVDVRDAFAHGAVPNFTPSELDTVGHLFVHAIELLRGAGIHHMTEKAAYFKWLNDGRQTNTRLKDWVSGEREIQTRIDS